MPCPIATHTCLATAHAQRGKAIWGFVRHNYLPVGSGLRVAGTFLTPTQGTTGRVDFNVVIPSSYEIVAPQGNATGILDGLPYHGARYLEAGTHTFLEKSDQQTLALVWAQAVDRHFLPLWRVAARGGSGQPPKKRQSQSSPLRPKK